MKHAIVEEQKQTVAAPLLGDGKYWSRVLIAILPSFLCSFMFLFFGPVDLCNQNRHIVGLFPSDVWIYFAAGTAAVFVGMTLVLALFRGKLFGVLVKLATGVALAAYVQALFFNGSMGLLVGDAYSWRDNVPAALISAAAWLVCMAVPFVLSVLLKNNRKAMIAILCVLLIGMQGAGLVGNLVSAKQSDIANGQDDRAIYFSSDNMYTVGSEDNVIVILVDAFSIRLFDGVREQYPEVLDAFNDFTYFDNVVSTYTKTFPSMTNYLVGYEYDFSKMLGENYHLAWNSPTAEALYGTMKEKDYSVEMFTLPGCVAIDADDLVDKVDNVRESDGTRKFYSRKSMIMKFLQLTAFRYLPNVLKDYVSMTTDDFSSLVTLTAFGESDGTEYVNDDHKFYTGLVDTKLSVIPDTSSFRYYHLNGPHQPFYFDANINRFPESEGRMGSDKLRIDAACGTLKITAEYIRQLKELGVYDNSTIIIMADHGEHYDDRTGKSMDCFSPIMLVKQKGQTGEALTTDSSALLLSDVTPTLIAAVDDTYDGSLGQTIFEIEGNDRVRSTAFYMQESLSSSGYDYLYVYVVEDRVSNDNFMGEPDSKIFLATGSVYGAGAQ